MNQRIKWIVAISNTYNCNITLLHLAATVEEAKQYLMNCIERDKEDSFEMCTECTENIDDIDVDEYPKSHVITELCAHACFDTYRIEYSVQPVDMIQEVTALDFI